MRYFEYYNSPLGPITLVSDETALVAVMFYHQRYYEKVLGVECERKITAPIEKGIQWLDLYFSGKEPDFLPPLRLEGTSFRRRVWELLMKIPYGSVTTYGELARRMAEEKGIERMSAQAIGGAVAHNPIAIMIPCHRVVGNNGALTGYAAGVQKKTALLNLEKGQLP